MMRILLILAAAAVMSCTSEPRSAGGNGSSIPAQATAGAPDRFGAYWYAGKAEVASYELKQARYGQVHTGTAVLIFVTEPFSTEKQVKSDDPEADDAITVLKTNHLRNFTTGIYDYSMMTSVFTPVSRDKYPHTLKQTASVQDWCGQAFAQMNFRDGGYAFEQRSYFESEGDVSGKFDAALTEDELFNLIRLKGADVPTGRLELIPSLTDSRLRHYAAEPTRATATLTEAGNRYIYTLDYKDLDRNLVIEFDQAFPYKIRKFSETVNSFGQQLTTVATYKADLHIDYWNRNKLQDAGLREQLGL